jgi:hypothetical protein
LQQIFFFHLPKAGGTALKSAMQRCFSDASFCPVFANDIVAHRKLAGDYSSYRGYDVYFGHYGRDVFNDVGQNHRCVTNFRHPIARLVSLYNYFRHMVPIQDGQAEDIAFRAVNFARRQSFADFIASTDPVVEAFVCNTHYRQLSNNMWSFEDVSSVAEVCRFIDAMPCYYVCEFPALSRIWMRRALGIRGVAVDNVTQGDGLVNPETLDGSVLDLLCERNTLDLALYRHALDRLLRLGFQS